MFSSQVWRSPPTSPDSGKRSATNCLSFLRSPCLPRDDAGRILLVQIADTGQWATIGGAIEPDESPEDAAVREAVEEAGVGLVLGALLRVLGGPDYRLVYPNGDQTCYVTTVFDARVISGSPTPDGDETIAVRWWAPDALPVEQMSTFTNALFEAVLGPA